MGAEIVSGAFAAWVKPFNIAECQASTLESVIRGRHIQVDLAAACWRDTNLRTEEGNNRDKFTVSLLKHATVLGHVPREFLQEFWHFLRHGEAITCEVTNLRKVSGV